MRAKVKITQHLFNSKNRKVTGILTVARGEADLVYLWMNHMKRQMSFVKTVDYSHNSDIRQGCDQIDAEVKIFCEKKGINLKNQL